MAAFARQLPPDALCLTLPPSHRVALLPVHDAKKVEALAATAIEKGAVSGGSSRGGREVQFTHGYEAC